MQTGSPTGHAHNTALLHSVKPATAIDGKIYVTSATDGNAESWPKSLYVYDFQKKLWQQRADYHFVHVGGAGGVVGGKLCLAGGEDPGGQITTLEVYDPANDQWRTRKPMPTARSGGTGVVLRDKFYVLGGFDGTNTLRTVEAYDSRADTWTVEPSMLVARDGCGAAVIDGVIYAFGGGTNRAGQIAETVERWKPGEEWAVLHPVEPMHVPVARGGVAVIGSTLYIAGGNGGTGRFPNWRRIFPIVRAEDGNHSPQCRSPDSRARPYRLRARFTCWVAGMTCPAPNACRAPTCLLTARCTINGGGFRHAQFIDR